MSLPNNPDPQPPFKGYISKVSQSRFFFDLFIIKIGEKTCSPAYSSIPTPLQILNKIAVVLLSSLIFTITAFEISLSSARKAIFKCWEGPSFQTFPRAATTLGSSVE